MNKMDEPNDESCCKKVMDVTQQLQNTLAECFGKGMLDQSDYTDISYLVEMVTQKFTIAYLGYIKKGNLDK